MHRIADEARQSAKTRRKEGPREVTSRDVSLAGWSSRICGPDVSHDRGGDGQEGAALPAQLPCSSHDRGRRDARVV